VGEEEFGKVNEWFGGAVLEGVLVAGDVGD
jgi:hypothetical protein